MPALANEMTPFEHQAFVISGYLIAQNDKVKAE